MSTVLFDARNQLKTHINAYAPISAVQVFVERQGVDIDKTVEDAIEAKGLAIIILESSAGIADQIRQGGASLRVTVPICILENPKANAAASGHKIPSEDVLVHLIRALIGKPVANGEVTLNPEVFARTGDESGLIEHYVGFDVPVILRGT